MDTSQNNHDDVYGLLAEFADGDALRNAASASQSAGYQRVDAYSPMPVEGLAEVLGFRRTRLPLVVLIGGIIGGVAGYLMQWYLLVVDYPLNVGGRPLHSWPMFIPIVFEMTVLFAAIAALLGMLALNRLPMPHHALFNVPSFSLASQDRFFLCIEAADPKFDLERTTAFLRQQHPTEVFIVPK